MKLKNLVEKLEIVGLAADLETEITGICYDSRLCREGDLFVAIKGLATDGHKYIPMAKTKGAAAVLCEEVPTEEIPYVLVKNSRLGLALASCEFFGHPSREMTMIGITGTSGKTSSSYLIKHLLETKLNAKVGLIGTNGNMIGEKSLHTEHTTPESRELQELFRAMVDEGCTHVVMEVSSHSLAMERVAGIHYDVAEFTNLSQDHLDLHGTMEEYALEKRKLFYQCETACVNVDDKWADIICGDTPCKKLGFSAENTAAGLAAGNIQFSAEGVCFEAVYGDKRSMAQLAIPGSFSVYNALGVIAVGLALGISLEDCTEALSTAKGVKGRVETVPTDGDYSILIDYSHKPDALEKVLKSLRPVTKGRLIALFGCGGDRDRAKRPIMGAIAADNSDFVIVTSDNPRTEDPNAIIDEILAGLENKCTPKKVVCDRVEAIHWAIDNALPGDVILLAGKGHEDYQIVGREKHHMDEREIVAEYLEKRKAGVK